MKIKRTDIRLLSTGVDVWHLPVGTVFEGKIRGWERSTYLKVYEGIVDLASPNNTFMSPRDRLIATEYEELEAEVSTRRKDD